MPSKQPPALSREQLISVQKEIKRTEKLLAVIESNLTPEQLRSAQRTFQAKRQRAEDRHARAERSI